MQQQADTRLARLRERAEQAIADGHRMETIPSEEQSVLDALHLLEELRIYQTELEVQNEELLEAQSQTDRALEKYRFLFNHLPLPGIVVDGAGGILEFNDQARAWLGPRAALLPLAQVSIFQLFAGSSHGPLYQVLRDRANPAPQTLERLPLRRDDGRTVPCDLLVMHLRTDAAEGEQSLAILVDRSVEEALTASEERLRAASQAKNEFLANMSHEIRTPMNAVLGLAHLLRDTSLDDRQRDYLDQLQTAAGGLLDLLNDILDYSRIEAGFLALESIPLCLADLLERTRALFQRQAGERGLDLSIQLAPDLPCWLRGDPLRLSQVLHNLVGNALKFTRRGGVRVEVVRLPDPDADRILLRVAVADTGIGLTETQRGQLFQPFQQADASMTRRYGGTGLGLSISRRLVELMGGTIGVESTPDVGSTFWFTVPLGSAEPAASTGATGECPAEAAAAPRALLAELAIPIRGARVLLVDDQPVNRLIVGTYLTWMGLTFETAEDGAAAVARAEARTFDVILMDVQMPVMDGLAATRAIRARPDGQRVPILALTAAAMRDDQAATAAAGMNAHLAKPIDPLALARALLRWIPTRAAAPPSAVPAEAPALPPALATLDPALARRALARFHHDFADAPRQLEEALRHGDHETARRLVHTIKGLAPTLGADALHDQAERCEAWLRQCRDGADPAPWHAFARALRDLLAMTAPHDVPVDRPADRTPRTAPVPANLQSGLRLLADLLATRQSRARRVNAEIEEQLAGTGLGEAYAPISRAIDRLDYQTALIRLQQFNQQQGWR